MSGRWTRCNWHPEHSADDRPTGLRCGATATHRIVWLDGSHRYSYACGAHLELDPQAQPHRIERLEPTTTARRTAMRALTLTQPWAGLVASGIKLIENRPRSIIKREDFGKPFALHASREIDESVYERIHEIAPELVDHDDEGIPAEWFRLSRITSAVIAIATIDSMIDPLAHGIDPGHPDAAAPLPSDQRRWFFGPIGYVLRDVRSLATPAPCRGWQGFWTLTPDLERAVMEQLR